MRAATVCSGIGAPDLAAELLGWDLFFKSETDKFATQVLKHNFGYGRIYEDFRQINTKDWVDGLDCFVAGTPCQDFSHAGLRSGISGDRGNLTLEFIRMVKETYCKWGVIENVPGLLTRDFGHVLNAITGRDDLHRWRQWPSAGFIERGSSGYTAAWRVFDAQFFGVPQRRRRVFVVFSAGAEAGPCNVLFEPQSGPRNVKARRRKRKTVSGGFSKRSGRAEQAELTIYTITGNSIGRAPKHGGNQLGVGGDILPTATAADRHAVMTLENNLTDARLKESPIAQTLTARMGEGGGHLPIVYSNHSIDARAEEIEEMNAIAGGHRNIPLVLANDAARATLTEDLAPTILSTQKDGPKPIVLSSTQSKATVDEDKTPALPASEGSKPILGYESVLRYLTPTEIERAFGFPDGWTDIPGSSKGKRYRALGNSMAVPVIRWIMERLELQHQREMTG